VERARSESVGFVRCFGERRAAIAERDEFFGQFAGSIGADRFTNAADSAARAGGSTSEHKQRSECDERFEFERRCKQPAGQDAAATVHAADSNLRFEHTARELGSFAATVADLQRKQSATALGGHGLNQFRAFERHLRFE
jgi:hypothetical protein